MSLWVALILGIVQGLTEFLPVSSSGHLTLLNKIFGINENTLLLVILLHLATLFAVFFVLRKEIWNLICHPFSSMAKKLYVATLPTVLIVFLTKGFLEDAFSSAKLLPYFFLLTALLLLVTYFIDKHYNSKKCNDKGFLTPFVMGIAQGFAVLPGVSRSGSTICAGLLCGEKKEDVAKFSFLMSVPIILGSMIYEIINGNYGILANNEILFPTVVAFLSAFLVGILAIKIMLKVVKEAKYYYFSIYLFALSIFSFFVV